MIKFKKLKVKGFKSFVEPTEIIIENGLTGIVGPNGCGKSNLVEAFRFVMGELSPKQMRGRELDDVIFNGTTDRPAWDIAEVTIDLDNSSRNAPNLFNQSDEIEVTRRIWRGEGSEYRVNGKEVRLKDVQLLFADASTGARSTSMVSQGRVGAIIAAKPEQRRSLLEEAAGITGLHSRRHEAELRLNSTENNLERVKDVLKTQDEQLEVLKKQSKQAERYKNIQKDITRARATVFYQKWQVEKNKLDETNQRYDSHNTLVTNQTQTVVSINVEYEKVQHDILYTDGDVHTRDWHIVGAPDIMKKLIPMFEFSKENIDLIIGHERPQANIYNLFYKINKIKRKTLLRYDNKKGLEPSLYNINSVGDHIDFGLARSICL